MVGCERDTNKCWGISKFACILYLLILYLTIKIHKCRFVIHTKISNNFGKPHNFGIFFSKTTLVIKKTSRIILILNFE